MPASKKTDNTSAKKVATSKATPKKAQKTKSKGSSPQKTKKPSSARSKAEGKTTKKSRRTTKSATSAKTKAQANDEQKRLWSEAAKKVLEKRNRHTPLVFKLPSKKNTPIFFSIDEVREVIAERKSQETVSKEQPKNKTNTERESSTAQKDQITTTEELTERRNWEAASLDDILGLNAPPPKKVKQRDASAVSGEFKPYYYLLVDLHQQVSQGLTNHTKDTLKRSQRDDSGDLCSYGQHMADAGTDTFDRDFALSLVSNEQELLSEIDRAIDRIFDGTYGTCEITGQAIDPERLKAVPFTRFSLEGQATYERKQAKRVQRSGAFIEARAEDAAFTDQDVEE